MMQVPTSLMNHIEHQYGPYVVTTDRSRLDLEVIHQFLTHSYWAEGIPRARLWMLHASGEAREARRLRV